MQKTRKDPTPRYIDLPPPAIPQQGEYLTWTIAEVVDMHKRGKINLNPPFQRGDVWSNKMRSDLIGSLWDNYNIPPAVFNKITIAKTGATRYNTIDSKQRITSFLMFFANEIPAKIGKLKVYAEFNPKYPRRWVITPDYLEPMLERRIAVTVFDNLDESEELEVFRRQQISMTLTKGERKRADATLEGQLVRDIGTSLADDIEFILAGDYRDFSLMWITTILFMGITGNFGYGASNENMMNTIYAYGNLDEQRKRCEWIILMMAEKLRRMPAELLANTFTKYVSTCAGLFARMLLWEAGMTFNPPKGTQIILDNCPDVNVAFNNTVEIVTSIGVGVSWETVIAKYKQFARAATNRHIVGVR